MKTNSQNDPPEREPARAYDEESSLFGFDGPRQDGWMDLLRRSQRDTRVGFSESFELLEEVGRGGQGVVYRARQVGTNRTVAVKRMAAGGLTGERARRRFEREVEIVSGLRHPGIVTVYGIENVDGLPSLAMEWVEGRPITAWCHDELSDGAIGPLLERFLEVCDAVEHAHRNGVLHRDLKPSNILVDESATVRVLDFGIAKSLDDDSAPTSDRLTGTLDFLGTPAYASPEQLDGKLEALDTRGDVYSLGVVLFEMLTGTLPFPADGGLRAMFDARQRTLAPPSSLRPGLDRELDVIVAKALAFEPGERYQSVGALADDLRRHRRGDAVLAHAPSAVYQLKKLVRRNRVAAGLATALLLSLFVIAGLSVWQSRRVARERDQAVRAALRAQVSMGLFLESIGEVGLADSGRDVTVLEVLEAAVRNLDRGGVDPWYEAQVRMNLASSFEEANDYRKARAQASRAMELARDTDPLIWARSASTFATTSLQLGEPDGIAELADEVLACFEADQPNDPFIKVAVLSELGTCHKRLGDPQRAEALLRRSLALHPQLSGANVDSLRFWTVVELVATLQDQGRYEDAERIIESERPGWIERFGADSYQATVTLDLLVDNRLNAGVLASEEYVALRREVLGKYENLGDGVRNLTAKARVSLGHALVGEDPLEAVAVLRTALGELDEMYGRESKPYGNALYCLGQAKVKLGDFEAALAILQEALDVYLALFGRETGYSTRARRWISMALKNSGRLEEALEHAEKADANARELNSAEEADYYAFAGDKARVLYAMGQHEEALAVADEAVAGLAQAQRPSEQKIRDELTLLARWFDRVDEAARAERVRAAIDARLAP